MERLIETTLRKTTVSRKDPCLLDFLLRSSGRHGWMISAGR